MTSVLVRVLVMVLMRLSPMGSCLNTWPLLVELFGKDGRCGLIEGDMALGVGFEDSKAHHPFLVSLSSAPCLWIKT